MWKRNIDAMKAAAATADMQESLAARMQSIQQSAGLRVLNRLATQWAKSTLGGAFHVWLRRVRVSQLNDTEAALNARLLAVRA